MKHIVGEIGGYDVVYIPEKDVIFCKNTTLSYPLIERIVRSKQERTNIPEKNLTVILDNGVVNLGCLTTTLENCLEIRRKVHELKV